MVKPMGFREPCGGSAASPPRMGNRDQIRRRTVVPLVAGEYEARLASLPQRITGMMEGM